MTSSNPSDPPDLLPTAAVPAATQLQQQQPEGGEEPTVDLSDIYALGGGSDAAAGQGRPVGGPAAAVVGSAPQQGYGATGITGDIPSFETFKTATVNNSNTLTPPQYQPGGGQSDATQSVRLRASSEAGPAGDSRGFGSWLAQNSYTVNSAVTGGAADPNSFTVRSVRPWAGNTFKSGMHGIQVADLEMPPGGGSAGLEIKARAFQVRMEDGQVDWIAVSGMMLSFFLIICFWDIEAFSVSLAIESIFRVEDRHSRRASFVELTLHLCFALTGALILAARHFFIPRTSRAVGGQTDTAKVLAGLGGCLLGVGAWEAFETLVRLCVGGEDTKVSLVVYCCMLVVLLVAAALHHHFTGYDIIAHMEIDTVLVYDPHPKEAKFFDDEDDHLHSKAA